MTGSRFVAKEPDHATCDERGLTFLHTVAAHSVMPSTMTATPCGRGTASKMLAISAVIFF